MPVDTKLKVIGTWSREDTATVCDGVVTRYTSGNAEISASRRGVLVSDLFISSESNWKNVQVILERAWHQYQHLKPNSGRLYSIVAPLTEEQLEDALKER